MRAHSTRPRSAAIVAVLAGSLVFTLVPPASAGEMTDPQGDTVNSDTGQRMDVPEADILKSWIRVEAGGIVLGVQVRKPTDPATDKAWVDGDSDAVWYLDVNGDSKPDYEADLSNNDGKVTGGVSRADSKDKDQDLCAVSKLSYSATDGYTVTVDRGCLGSPKTIAYQAEFSYDTKPGDDNAPDATDVSPDQGMSPPVGAG